MTSDKSNLRTRVSETLCSSDALLTACSLEFCPSKSNLLTCGLYQTDQLKDGTSKDGMDPQTQRVGGCVLYDLCIEGEMRDANKTDSTYFDEIQRIKCPAVLDKKWNQGIDPVLITAGSEGNLNSFYLKESDETYKSQLQLIEKNSCAPSYVLCLSLDISDKRDWFEGGVTGIRSHHLSKHTFAVGSYDEVLPIFDKQNFSKALWNHNCGGVAAMHDGFKILDINSAGLNTPPQINTIYNGNSSLAYGADWGETVLMNGKSSTIVGSCLFYD
ncbi:hypothetical protein PPACK8108_LOCUS12963 [Phakopsora pachyrhizi]|uniref:Uncharacterized protein n=1 Tax=Phakopsora pachyrhizi TaxID=170000 RepID=A0AAV0B573_PHAPC|nr:hypothetical protein PPACK8108_LOCUS12963 [Phakopsora pachyrhizi]